MMWRAETGQGDRGQWLTDLCRSRFGGTAEWPTSNNGGTSDHKNLNFYFDHLCVSVVILELGVLRILGWNSYTVIKT